MLDKMNKMNVLHRGLQELRQRLKRKGQQTNRVTFDINLATSAKRDIEIANYDDVQAAILESKKNFK